MDCAAKAKCAEAVRAAALGFLETGKAPVGQVTLAKGKTRQSESCVSIPLLPLPVPDYLLPLMCQAKQVHATQGPHFDVLLNMAIDAKKPDDVLHGYDKMHATDKRSAGPWGRYGLDTNSSPVAVGKRSQDRIEHRVEMLAHVFGEEA